LLWAGRKQLPRHAAEDSYNAAEHNVELDKVNIADNTLVAPRAGRLQYRISEPGEVLPAGGKVFTVLDISDVYMVICRRSKPASQDRDRRSYRARCLSRPSYKVQSRVSRHARTASKAVETKSERDKLMFRVKVRIDPDLLIKYAESLRTGLPGIAHVRV
jgi:HlyD family secretion protein